MTFAVVVAMDDTGGIGLKGALPWHLPADMRHFRQLTSAHPEGALPNAVIMGRHTWESLPKTYAPLPNRLNIVVTSRPWEGDPTVLPAADLDQALALARARLCHKVFVIGGSQLYAAAMAHPDCSQALVTEVRGDFHCDVFFPRHTLESFTLTAAEPTQGQGAVCRFLVYERRQATAR